MGKSSSSLLQFVLASLALACAAPLSAGPVYQPPGANLTYGDVTHGQRVLSASTNPAAAAADLTRADGKPTRGTVFSVLAGLEYGQLDNLFAFYDELTRGYDPSDPGEGGGPGQNPGDKPGGGIDLGEIWDQLDPDARAAAEAIAAEIARQAVLLGVIRNEGYARAWASADLPIVLGKNLMGGAWTLGLNWSGSSKAFGLADDIDFDLAAAEQALRDWLNELPANRPNTLPVSNEVALYYDPATNGVALGINNDSSIISKASQTTEFDAGYSRLAWSNDAGNLFLGGRARLYLMRLSRLSVRFGDITNSEDLFDAIKNSEFRNDTRLGVDVGALWVTDNYQLGAQITNLNRPKFGFPEVDLQPYKDQRIIDFLQRDQTYRMDAQLKLEASYFGEHRRWSAHLGVDGNAAKDPLGDEYQWLTLSTGFITNRRWLPNVRAGYRENLAGSGTRYLSAGLTAFEFVNFDISTSLDSARIDGRELPKGLMASIGFQITW